MAMTEAAASALIDLAGVRKSYNIGTPVETEILHGISIALQAADECRGGHDRHVGHGAGDLVTAIRLLRSGVPVRWANRAFTDRGRSFPAGTLLVINGETGAADIYAVDKTTGAVLATLSTSFGVSHVAQAAAIAIMLPLKQIAPRLVDWLRANPNGKALFLHSSRYRVGTVPFFEFEESHSHAPRQFLHLRQIHGPCPCPGHAPCPARVPRLGCARIEWGAASNSGAGGSR